MSEVPLYQEGGGRFLMRKVPLWGFTRSATVLFTHARTPHTNGLALILLLHILQKRVEMGGDGIMRRREVAGVVGALHGNHRSRRRCVDFHLIDLHLIDPRPQRDDLRLKNTDKQANQTDVCVVEKACGLLRASAERGQWLRGRAGALSECICFERAQSERRASAVASREGRGFE